MSGVRFEWNDGLGVIELDDAQTRNSLNDEIVEQVRAKLREWATAPDLRGLVLTGANGAFSSGGRLDMIGDRREEAKTEGGREAIAKQMRENSKLVEELRSFPAPTVAAVDGACVGAAIGWACACDLRIASDRAKFITGFAKVGLSTDFGTARLLAETVGRGRATSWLLTSPAVTAGQALDAGLVTNVVAPDELRSAALELAAGSDARASVAIRANLSEVNVPLSDALDAEAARFAQML